MPAQGLVNKVMELLMSKRMRQIESFMTHPIETQENVLFDILSHARNTEYGNKFGFNEINTYDTFQNQVPIVTYEEFEPFIEKARKGGENISWHGKIKWFAKSSGTTNAKSTFI